MYTMSPEWDSGEEEAMSATEYHPEESIVPRPIDRSIHPGLVTMVMRIIVLKNRSLH